MIGRRTTSLCVVGSINVDLIAHAERLPGPGETVGEASLCREPGGKGANQAAAAARLGAATRMIGAVGGDADGRWMIDALRAAGVDTTGVATVDEPTGAALIVVDRHGENQIAVCPGANRRVSVADLTLAEGEVVLTQLEVPMQVVSRLAHVTAGYLAVNAAPARPLPSEVLARANLFIANETEYRLLPELRGAALVAVTYGSAGAALFAHGRRVADAPAAPSTVVNTVGAGDAFSAAITIALASGLDHEAGLAAACAVGGAAVADPASQPELMPLHTYLPDR